MSTSLIEAGQLEAIKKLDLTIRRTNSEVREAEEAGNPMITAVAMARGMTAIRDGMQPLMGSLMQLMGTPLGFRTDRDSGGNKYTAEQVRDALIVGLMRGLRVVGNEINIIGGNCYATKEGMKRLVKEYPGVTNLRIQFGVPQAMKDGALVPATVTWRLNGVADAMDCAESAEGDRRIPVRVNSGMGVDAILGKAESKIYRRLYLLLTGTDQAVVDDGDVLAEHTAGEPVAATAPETNLITEFMHGIEACDKSGQPTALYDDWFGPDSRKKEWTPEEDETARLAVNNREEGLKPNRGLKSNKQQELVK